MELLHKLPADLFVCVIHSVVEIVGLYKALRLRVVSRTYAPRLYHLAKTKHTVDLWNESILQAIFECGAVDFFDFETIPDASLDTIAPVDGSQLTPHGWDNAAVGRMSASLMARLLLVRVRRFPNANKINLGLSQALKVVEHGTGKYAVPVS